MSDSIPTIRRRIGVFTVLTLLGGCALPAEDATAGQVESGREGELGAVQRTLVLGMQGDDVAVVNHALAKYGYFPNPQLQHDYPAWRPIVASAPHDPREFDEQTLAAVEAYQRNSGVAVTGEVDPATLEQMTARSCGVPDGIAPPQPDEKFDVGGSRGRRNYTYRVLNNDDLDATTTQNLFAQAFQMWANETDITFTQVPTSDDTADFMMAFWTLDGPGGFVARTFESKTVIFDIEEQWVNQFPAPAGTLDLVQFAAHEIGHLMLLNHSSYPVLMRADGGFVRTPQLDDRTAIRLAYDQWTNVGTTTALDVAVPPNSGNTIWFTTSDGGIRTNAGQDETRFVSTSLPSGRKARRIAVGPGNIPWATDQDGRIYCRNSIVSGSWTRKPGCARDIAANSSRSLWALDCLGRAMKWTPSSTCSSTSTTPWKLVTPMPAGESGTNITVVREGYPAVITNTNRILRLPNPDATSSTAWQELPTASGAFGRGLDVSADDNGYLWVVGLDNRFWIYNEQWCTNSVDLSQCPPGVVDPGDNGASAKQQWTPMFNGTGLKIAAGNGGLSIVGMNNQIWTTAR